VVRAEHADGAIHYLNLLSTGFSARAGALTNARFKGLGAAGYVVAVVWSVLGLEHPVLPLRLDEGDDVDARPSVLLSFSNSRYTAGTMCMAPLADPGDGALDVIRVGDLGRIAFLGAFPSIFAGRHVERPDVEQVRARRVRFEPVGVQDVMVDGEILRLDLRALEVLPGAIEVVA
jgi:diacylglycerol kinase (ATP)